MPFFSIITVAFNAQDSIKETLSSVLEQDFDDYEIIVKDACSNDNTIANIPKDDRIKVYITEDKGIYYGMNEAINYTSGKYLYFLNCGDTLYNKNVLSNVHNQICNSNYPSLIYGDYRRNNIICKQPCKITDFYLYRTSLCHQSMFFSKKIFKELGLYNTEYKICADHDFTFYAYFKNMRFAYLPSIICNYLGGGFSESEKGSLLRNDEYKRMKNKYFSKSKQRWYDFKLFLSLKGLRQKLASDKSPLFIRKIYRRLVNFVNG